MAFLLNFFLVRPLNALTELSSFSQIADQQSIEKVVVPLSQKEDLQEIPAPGVCETIRSRLMGHQPRLRILSPVNGEILLKTPNEKWEIVFDLQDWPLVEDPEFGLGPHLVIQVDDAQPIRISDSDGGRISIPMNALNPGSHRLVAYLAYPWGEA